MISKLLNANWYESVTLNAGAGWPTTAVVAANAGSAASINAERRNFIAETPCFAATPARCARFEQ